MGTGTTTLNGSRLRLDGLLHVCLGAGRKQLLLVAGLLLGAIALSDWRIGIDVSLSVLYILPMVVAAIVLPARWVVILALFCATLAWCFDGPHAVAEQILRFLFAALAYSIAGFFVAALMQNQEEQNRRAAAEEQLKTLVDSSPAGILTLNGRGEVLAANRAVSEVLGLPPDSGLNGRNISRYLPVLGDALQLDTGARPIRTAVQSQGRRETGEMFLADIWFSTYITPKGKRLAAIVIDSSEEMRSREEQNLRQLSLSSRIMAGAMLHEVRNLCGAISVLYSNTGNREPVELQGLEHLVQGLGRIASLELHPSEAAPLEAVALRDVLNDVRIIAEPVWADIGGAIRWDIQNETIRVLAERHGLLQVFLNLVQNSHRAVQSGPKRELVVAVTGSAEKALIRFADCGTGVASPELLFQPFQPGASGTGLGLYIARSILRSYGGDLRYEAAERGAVFVAELVRVAHKTGETR